mgnify:CR=1 FL=1
MNYKRVLSVAACLLLLFLGGRQFYFIPTVKISIDINPSMELGVNRFDRIVSVEGYNDDGKIWQMSWILSLWITKKQLTVLWKTEKSKLYYLAMRS